MEKEQWKNAEVRRKGKHRGTNILQRYALVFTGALI